MLIAALRDDDDCAAASLGDGQVRILSGAALRRICGMRMESCRSGPSAARCRWCRLGSTETITARHRLPIFQPKRSAISARRSRTELKLVPSGDKLEVRVRRPNVTPGYWKAPELTAQAFDADGFYLIGDAVTFRRSGPPRAWIVFRRPLSRGFQTQFRHLGQPRTLRSRYHRAGAFSEDVVASAMAAITYVFWYFEPQCLPRAGRLARER